MTKQSPTKTLRILLLLVYGLFGVGCTHAELPIPTQMDFVPSLTTSSARIFVENWGMRWIDNQPCQTPCWEGIIPGVTSRDEVVQTLINMPIVEYTYYARREGRISLRWDAVSPDYYTADITFDVSKNPNIVESIWIQFPKNINLLNVVDSLEEPKLALLGWCNPFTSYYLSFYSYHNGIVLASPESSVQYKIAPDLQFSGVSFHSSDRMKKFEETYMQDWHGYNADYNVLNYKGTHEVFDNSTCVSTPVP